MQNEGNIHINEEIFVKAYEHYWKDLYLMSSRYVQNAELARELVQELFIYLWEKRDVIQVHTSLKSYLFSAMKLKIMEHYRKQAVREQYIVYRTAAAETEEKNTTEGEVFFNDLNKAFQSAVESLPERSREVYRLSREKNMDNKSIAAMLLISEKAVEGNMTRAIAFIRKRLKYFR